MFNNKITNSSKEKWDKLERDFLKNKESFGQKECIYFIAQFQHSNIEHFKKFIETHIPQSYLTYEEFVIKCFCFNPRIVACLDKKFKTQDFYWKLVNRTLEHFGADKIGFKKPIPEEFKTLKPCFDDWSCPFSFENVSMNPEKAQQALDFGFPIMLIPKNLRSYKLCLLEVKKGFVHMEQFIPKKHQTEELCKAYVEASGGKLYRIPEDKRTPELCLYALQHHRHKHASYKDVPKIGKKVSNNQMAMKELEVLINKNLVKTTISEIKYA